MIPYAMDEILYPDSVPEHIVIAMRKNREPRCAICGVQSNVVVGKHHLCNKCLKMLRKGGNPWELKNLQKELK